MAFYDEEYREDLARRKGFSSFKEYSKYLLAKRKEKLEEFKKEIKEKIETERKEEIHEFDLGEYLKEKDKIPILERSQEERTKYFEEQKVCQSLQRIVSEVKDEESIFTDIKFIEKYTGCKIKKKRKKSKKLMTKKIHLD